MKLLFIHGMPAAGKLTVAKEIENSITSKLFDNHVAIDSALSIFEFGAPGFWGLVQNIRTSVLTAALEHNVQIVIMTYCYSAPEDKTDIDQFEDIYKSFGGEILPVYLHCSEQEAMNRIGNIDRVKRKKVSTKNGLKNFLNENNITCLPNKNCLKLSTENTTAEETAEFIIQHFELRSFLKI